jgi:hypothetical protein
METGGASGAFDALNVRGGVCAVFEACQQFFHVVAALALGKAVNQNFFHGLPLL